MAALKLNYSNILPAIAKIGFALYLSQQSGGTQPILLAELGNSVASVLKIEKAPNVLRDFQKLVRNAIDETLRMHEFVFQSEQINRISESILSLEHMQGYLRIDGPELLRERFISALDAIAYPYEEPVCRLDIDSLLENILTKIRKGILKDENLINLDSNVKLDMVLEKLDQFQDFIEPKTKISHKLTDLDLFLPENILHRQKQVVALKEMLETEKMIMITGIGGVGKTLLARAVCESINSEYKHIAWLTYEGNLDDQLLRMHLWIQNPNRNDRLEQIKQFLRSIEEPVLIILDNVNEKPSKDDLKTLGSFADSVRVLMTSRLLKIRGIHAFPLEFLSTEQCMDVFSYYYSGDERRQHTEIVRHIVNAFSRHTLTIELIARMADKEANDLPEIWKLLQRNGLVYSNLEVESYHDPDPMLIQEHIRLLFYMSDMDEAKRKIMRIFSILPYSSPIPMKIRDWIPCDGNDLNWLVDRGWVQQAGRMYIMHQIVQESIQLQEKPNLDECRGLVDAFSQTDYVPATMIYTHAAERLTLSESLIAWFQPTPEETWFAAFLFWTAGFYKESQGNYAKALEYTQKALLIREKVLGLEHPDTAATYNNLAGLYESQSDYAKALEYYQKALLIKEKVLGLEHPSTGTTYNNLAGLYQIQGDYPHSLEYYQKARLIREKALGLEHPDTATTYNNLAMLYKRQGDYNHAFEYYQIALNIYEKVLGLKHPDTAATYNNLAALYESQGEYSSATEYCRKALIIYEEVLGSEHPNTATTYNNLAFLFANQDDFPQAMKYFHKALVVYEKVLGSEHPETATIYNNLGLLYMRQGEYHLAFEYDQKSREIREKVLGLEHPDTAATYNNLAGLYVSQGDYPRALEFYLKSYRIFLVKLGLNHPKTKIIRGNLEWVYRESIICTQPFTEWLEDVLRK